MVARTPARTGLRRRRDREVRSGLRRRCARRRGRGGSRHSGRPIRAARNTRRVHVRLQRGSIGRDVVRDKLAEKRPAGSFGAKRRLVVGVLSAVAESAGAAEREQKGLVGREGRQVREETRVELVTPPGRSVDQSCERRRVNFSVVRRTIRSFLHSRPRARLHTLSESAPINRGTAPAVHVPTACCAAQPRGITTQCTSEAHRYSSFLLAQDPADARRSFASGSQRR
jgi:hypothetical protein